MLQKLRQHSAIYKQTCTYSDRENPTKLTGQTTNHRRFFRPGSGRLHSTTLYAYETRSLTQAYRIANTTQATLAGSTAAFSLRLHCRHMMAWLHGGVRTRGLDMRPVRFVACSTALYEYPYRTEQRVRPDSFFRSNWSGTLHWHTMSVGTLVSFHVTFEYAHKSCGTDASNC